MTPSAPALTPSERASFLELVHLHFGIRGSDYGASRIDQALHNVLPTTGCATAAELLESCDSGANPLWLYALVEYLTVGETYFLRDSAQISAVRNAVLPSILERRARERRMRIWSAGCSTGEEVYTLAILLSEANVVPTWDIALVGTDINRESLRIARQGRYPDWSFRTTPAHVRERYFEPDREGWRVIEPLRRMARFAWMNLGADPIFPPAVDLDLALCRNVTIYFDDAATQRLYAALVRALAPGGWLILGPSDPVPTDRSGLERVELSETVLWRRVLPCGSVEKPVTPTRTPTPTRIPAPKRPVGRSVPRAVKPVSGSQTESNELEAGLLALEAGAAAFAVECLRRATFRHPDDAEAQFALARAYLATGELTRAHAALVHTRRLLAPLPGDGLLPGSDSTQVETLRQAVESYLEGVAA